MIHSHFILGICDFHFKVNDLQQDTVTTGNKL